MEVFPTSVALVIRALVVSARWAGRARRLALVCISTARGTGLRPPGGRLIRRLLTRQTLVLRTS